MADKSPNYSVERRRLELQKLEHAQTIAKGGFRIEEIQTQKELNIARAELANDELDDEIARIRTNEAALKKAVADIDANIQAMTKETGDG